MDRYTYIISSPACGKCKDLDTLLTRRGVPHEKLDAESEKGRMLVDRHELEHVGTMVLEENGATRVITMRDINELYPKG